MHALDNGTLLEHSRYYRRGHTQRRWCVRCDRKCSNLCDGGAAHSGGPVLVQQAERDVVGGRQQREQLPVGGVARVQLARQVGDGEACAMWGLRDQNMFTRAGSTSG